MIIDEDDDNDDKWIFVCYSDVECNEYDEFWWSRWWIAGDWEYHGDTMIRE